MRNFLFILGLIGGIALYSCNNNTTGGGNVSPSDPSSGSFSDSSIVFSVNGKVYTYYVPFILLVKSGSGYMPFDIVASPDKKTVNKGSLTLLIKDLKKATFLVKDKNASIVLQNPDFSPNIAGTCNATTSPGNLTITDITDSPDGVTKYITGNFSDSLCTLDGKKLGIKGSFQKLRLYNIDLNAAAANAGDIYISVNGGPKTKYTKALSNAAYSKEDNKTIIQFGVLSDLTDVVDIRASFTIIQTGNTLVNTYKVEGTNYCLYTESKDSPDLTSGDCTPPQGNIVITEAVKTTQLTPITYSGYISGTFSFAVCKEDGTKINIDVTFTKVKTSFTGF